MRAIASLVCVVALASCSAIDNFGKFTVAGGADMAGGGCTPGCDCIAADASLGVPDHCALAPSNGISCTGLARNAATVTIAAGLYTLDAGASPPSLTDPSGNIVMTGSVVGGSAVFCIGSLVADGGRVVLAGNRPVAIVADSLVRLTNGSWVLGGSYAVDANGAAGVAGGTQGGASGNAGAGANGGHAGVGSPGTGGGGGGSQATGGAGGPAMGTSAMTPGGPGSTAPANAFGGGGGGKGVVNGGGGGGGAGTLQLSAGWAIELDSVGFNASGGGGAGGLIMSGATGSAAGGGGGGGGGGLLWLEAPTVSVTAGCLSVAGGPGGGGGALTRGGDAKPTTICPFIGTGGIAPPNGGAGATPGVSGAGGPGSGIGGGGGGIGGYGRVTVRSHNPPPLETPPNVFPTQAYQPMTLP